MRDPRLVLVGAVVWLLLALATLLLLLRGADPGVALVAWTGGLLSWPLGGLLGAAAARAWRRRRP